MLDKLRINDDESDHIGCITDYDIIIFPIVFFIVESITVFLLIIFLDLEQGYLMGFIGKYQYIKSHYFKSFFIPSDQFFRFDVILIKVECCQEHNDCEDNYYDHICIIMKNIKK
jgi:hypothetical protein